MNSVKKQKKSCNYLFFDHVKEKSQKRIPNAPQIQAIWRCAGCFFQARLFNHGGTEFVQTDLASPNPKAHPNNQSDHATQKTVGSNVKYGSLPICVKDPLCARQLTNHGFGVVVALTKRRKFGVIQQQSCGGLHQFSVWLLYKRVEVDQMLRKRIFAKTEVVLVTALIGIKTCVGFGMYLKNAKNGDVFGQVFIEAAHKFYWKFVLKIKMGKVLPGMYAGIGAPTAGDLQFCTQNGVHAVFQGLLHGDFARLALPPEVMGAVVGEFDEVAWHGGCLKTKREVKLNISTSRLLRSIQYFD